MKFSTRNRYGLRLMVELARELKKNNLVHLGRIAGITGVSENYLAQLAIPLKNEGLLIGVSGKKGGYHLSRSPEEIKIMDVVRAVDGPINLTDCVNNPDICLNSSFCEARIMWAILSGRMVEVLEKYTLADLIDKDRLQRIKDEYAFLPMLNPDRIMAPEDEGEESEPGCPVKK
nr:Rrf2 family transcriptional regulator [candidate division Zixibacteria bacterium]